MVTSPHRHIQRAGREDLAVIRALAGSFASFFHRRSDEHDAERGAAGLASETGQAGT